MKERTASTSKRKLTQPFAVPLRKIEPMEARSVEAIPVGGSWQYEPKWDGFRCLLSRDGDGIAMMSKAERDLGRYFPEVLAAAAQLPQTHFVLDGELVIIQNDTFAFDALLQRIHPAPSRISRMSLERPACFLAFDILATGKENLAVLPLSLRRPALKAFAAKCFSGSSLRLSPASTRLKDAQTWLQDAGLGTDGVIAKRLDLPYQGGNRNGMLKIKRQRSADCVVGGFRYAAEPVDDAKVIGSLLLGLYDDAGLLHHVGFTSAFKGGEKPALTKKLEKLTAEGSFTGKAPGGASRWSTARSAQWVPLKPSLVVEVSYNHVTSDRFRHGTRILRWRSDKKPSQCTMQQLQQAAVSPLLDDT